MPELSRFYNIVIKMLFSDSDKHHNRKKKRPSPAFYKQIFTKR